MLWFRLLPEDRFILVTRRASGAKDVWFVALSKGTQLDVLAAGLQKRYCKVV